ncbi:MAG: hypothetical protein AAB209_01920 [Bacteroidota bacterium]|jgi:hypothetical protein
MAGFNTEAFAHRWCQLSLLEQMAHIGSEVERIASWKKKGNTELSTKALYRSLELLDLSLADPRWTGGTLRELARVREILCDAYVGDNTYNTTPEFLSKYFYSFAVAARRRIGS